MSFYNVREVGFETKHDEVPRKVAGAELRARQSTKMPENAQFYAPVTKKADTFVGKSIDQAFIEATKEMKPAVFHEVLKVNPSTPGLPQQTKMQKTAPGVPTGPVVSGDGLKKAVKQFRWSRVFSELFDSAPVAKLITDTLKQPEFKQIKKNLLKARNKVKTILGYATTAKGYAETILANPLARAGLESVIAAVGGQPEAIPLLESVYQSVESFKSYLPKSDYKTIDETISAIKNADNILGDVENGLTEAEAKTAALQDGLTEVETKTAQGVVENITFNDNRSRETQSVPTEHGSIRAAVAATLHTEEQRETAYDSRVKRDNKLIAETDATALKDAQEAYSLYEQVDALARAEHLKKNTDEEKFNALVHGRNEAAQVLKNLAKRGIDVNGIVKNDASLVRQLGLGDKKAKPTGQKGLSPGAPPGTPPGTPPGSPPTGPSPPLGSKNGLQSDDDDEDDEGGDPARTPLRERGVTRWSSEPIEPKDSWLRPEYGQPSRADLDRDAAAKNSLNPDIDEMQRDWIDTINMFKSDVKYNPDSTIHQWVSDNIELRYSGKLDLSPAFGDSRGSYLMAPNKYAVKPVREFNYRPVRGGIELQDTRVSKPTTLMTTRERQSPSSRRDAPIIVRANDMAKKKHSGYGFNSRAGIMGPWRRGPGHTF